MTFKQAKEKLKKLAKGQYCSLRYSEAVHSDGEQVADCAIYISSESTWHNSDTWEKVFKARQKALNPPKYTDEGQPE